MLSPSRAVLRLIALLTLSAGSFSLEPRALLPLGALLLLWGALQNSHLPGLWLQRMLRLKWFFLAIFVLYLFGGLQLSGRPDWEEAAYRVGVLALLVGIVAVSLDGLPAQELAQGLSRLLAPLRVLGLAVDSFSRRLAITLDAVAHMEARVRGLNRAGGLGAVAAVCDEAERYRAAEPDQAIPDAVALVDYAYLGLSIAAILGLQWL